MKKNKAIFIKLINNPAILYIVSRYGTYILRFVNSLFIALYLGPYYLGIWGFINLVLGYLGQINLGIPHSVNVIVSINKEKEEYVKKIIGNALSMIVGLSLAIILFFVISYFSGFHIGEKYNFKMYLLPVCTIAIFTHFNSLLSNIFRIYGDIIAIALNQSIYPILVILVTPFFRGAELLNVLVLVNCLSVFLSLVIFLVKKPVKLRFIWNIKIIKNIQIKGWHLFVYNTSFHLILLSTKSFISTNYSVDEFGYFTFSYSLANVVLLLLNSISYLIFPKMLNRFATGTIEYIQDTLKSIRIGYISLSHFMIHFLILFFPIFLYFFPQYKSSSDVFRIIALTILLNTNSFGYSGLVMAKGKEKFLGIIALVALLLNIIITYIFVIQLNVPLSYAMLGTMITYFVYVLVISKLGRKSINLISNTFATIRDVFPWRMMFPFIISMVVIFSEIADVYFIIPFISYIFLNIKDLKGVKNLILNVINNPKLINI